MTNAGISKLTYEMLENARHQNDLNHVPVNEYVLFLLRVL